LWATNDAPSAAGRDRDEDLRLVVVPLEGVRRALAWTRFLTGAAVFFFIAVVLGLERSDLQSFDLQD
jgi:hypothetical protein